MALGCDLACGSGDKLLSGPPAGLLVRGAELLARCRRHAPSRAPRPSRTAVAAHEGVQRLVHAGAPRPVDRLWPEPEARRRRLERIGQKAGLAENPATPATPA